MKKRRAAELIEDFDLYPRNNVDASHIRSLCDSLAAGVKFPPILIDQKSKRVVDGIHRLRAALRFFGDEAEIDVVEKTYPDEAAMFLDAMRLNAAHGAKLDSADRVHCAIVAERLKISLDKVAGALNVPKDKLGALVSDRTATAGRLKIALKNTNRHFAGKHLTERQIEANERSSGMNQAFYVNQLIDLIEAGLLNRDDAKLMERLTVLQGLLEEVLAASAA